MWKPGKLKNVGKKVYIIFTAIKEICIKVQCSSETFSCDQLFMTENGIGEDVTNKIYLVVNISKN